MLTHLRDVPVVGMNRVLAAAAERGFVTGDPDWVNLGQGQPDIGDLPGAPPRITTIELEPGDHAYAPANGTPALRDAVAEHYNRVYRVGKASLYTGANVAIVPGGRIGLNRAVAALGRIDLGYLLPDYTAYEDILDHNTPRVTPIGMAVPGTGADGILAALAATDARALLLSNPRNPTGEVISGTDLDRLVSGTRAAGRALLVDEFYSQYVYAPDAAGGYGPADRPVSAAEYVDDVDTDDVLLFDGLTKNFRYPGWRLGWIVGPSSTIETIGRIGLHLDGGTSQIAQRAALAALEQSAAERETTAVRAAFARKRDVMVTGLRAAGIRVDVEPRGTFYVWGRLDDLPPSLRHADDFFVAGLDHRVITVPGHAFDLNPGTDRARTGAFDHHIRFSYGPDATTVARGVERLIAMVARAPTPRDEPRSW